MNHIISYLLFLSLFICLNTGLNAQWEHKARYSGSGGVDRQICIAPDYCLMLSFRNILYQSTNQGKSWDSIYIFDKVPSTSAYPSLNCHYHVINQSSYNSIFKGN